MLRERKKLFIFSVHNCSWRRNKYCQRSWEWQERDNTRITESGGHRSPVYWGLLQVKWDISGNFDVKYISAFRFAFLIICTEWIFLFYFCLGLLQCFLWCLIWSEFLKKSDCKIKGRVKPNVFQRFASSDYLNSGGEKFFLRK